MDRRCSSSGQAVRFDIRRPADVFQFKAMGRRTWDVQRDHVELLVGVSRLLARGGEAVFSCNLRSFKPDYDEAPVSGRS